MDSFNGQRVDDTLGKLIIDILSLQYVCGHKDGENRECSPDSIWKRPHWSALVRRMSAHHGDVRIVSGHFLWMVAWNARYS
jgi:hypothetical protein